VEDGESGISLIGVLVRADGKVVSSVILNSSGSVTLDRTTADAFSKCTFLPARNGGEARDRWVRMAYTWDFTDQPALRKAKNDAALAAKQGNVAALYHLSLLLSETAKTDADRKKALVILHSAGEQGHAHAQFHLGLTYENGAGVEANLEEAMRWYQKSAAQGDPLAMQRLALGKLSD
jgi:TonB family protein